MEDSKIEICKKYSTHKWKELSENMLNKDFACALEKLKASDDVFQRM
jgi:hypothetical protein